MHTPSCCWRSHGLHSGTQLVPIVFAVHRLHGVIVLTGGPSFFRLGAVRLGRWRCVRLGRRRCGRHNQRYCVRLGHRCSVRLGHRRSVRGEVEIWMGAIDGFKHGLVKWLHTSHFFPPMIGKLKEFERSSANLPERLFLLLLIFEAECPRGVVEQLSQHLTTRGCKLLCALQDSLYCALRLLAFELNDRRQDDMALRARADAIQRSSAVGKQGAIF